MPANHLGKPIILSMTSGPDLDGWVASAFIARRFDLLRAADAATAINVLRTCRPDLLLLDASAVGPDAIALIEEEVSRLFSARWPIVMLARVDASVPGVLEDRVGSVIAIDCEPGMAATLLRAVLRRGRPAALTDRLAWGDIVLDQVERRATCRGQTLPLSFLEFNLLGLLLDSPGVVWTRSSLAEVIWRPRNTFDVPSINRTVQVLRRTLKRVGGRDPIETVKGTGYRLVEPLV